MRATCDTALVVAETRAWLDLKGKRAASNNQQHNNKLLRTNTFRVCPPPPPPIDGSQKTRKGGGRACCGGEAVEARQGDDGRSCRRQDHDQREDVGLLHLQRAYGKKNGGAALLYVAFSTAGERQGKKGDHPRITNASFVYTLPSQFRNSIRPPCPLSLALSSYGVCVLFVFVSRFYFWGQC